eukprot:gene4660-23256_t
MLPTGGVAPRQVLESRESRGAGEADERGSPDPDWADEQRPASRGASTDSGTQQQEEVLKLRQQLMEERRAHAAGQ